MITIIAVVFTIAVVITVAVVNNGAVTITDDAVFIGSSFSAICDEICRFHFLHNVDLLIKHTRSFVFSCTAPSVLTSL